jgi:hypothetical protein
VDPVHWQAVLTADLGEIFRLVSTFTRKPTEKDDTFVLDGTHAPSQTESPAFKEF